MARVSKRTVKKKRAPRFKACERSKWPTTEKEQDLARRIYRHIRGLAEGVSADSGGVLDRALFGSRNWQDLLEEVVFIRPIERTSTVEPGYCAFCSNVTMDPPPGVKFIRYSHNNYENDKYAWACKKHLSMEE